MLFQSTAISIIDYGEAAVPGTGCDSCEFAREPLLMFTLLFGTVGGMFGFLGIWALWKEMKAKPRNRFNVRELTGEAEKGNI
jgi:hypothetical protein